MTAGRLVIAEGPVVGAARLVIAAARRGSLRIVEPGGSVSRDPGGIGVCGVVSGRYACTDNPSLRLRPFRRLRVPSCGIVAAGGQASVLLVGALAAVLVGVLVLGAVARGVAEEAAAQRAVDLAALAGARAMYEAGPRLFEPVTIDGIPNPRHLTRDAYLALARDAADGVARANGVEHAVVGFPDGATFAPMRIEVAARAVVEVRRGEERREVAIDVVAEAELAPAIFDVAAGGGYDGPLAYRQGKPMRPDVALAFDRLERAAREDGVTLLISSGYRSDAEQAELFRLNPDPKWVAPPGTSLHRNGTELDLGPPSAYPWLAQHAARFHFIQRYPHEPWHYGYTLNPRSTPRPASGDGGSAVPAFVPPRFAPLLARAAQRWNVSAALLAAQLYAESNFNPFADSGEAQGIAQFTEGTARAMGLEDPFAPGPAIDAQAHLMRDLLRRFASVPLALAAYNAGEGAVAGCMCVPPYPETRGYVARILALLRGAGEIVPGAGLSVRLVR